MAEMRSPEIEAILRGMAASMAQEETPRLLWICAIPGLTSDLLRAACRKVGAMKMARLGDRDVELWPKVGEVTGQRWREIRHECERLCGVPPNSSIVATPAPSWWRRDLEAWQRSKGIVTVPRSTGG